MDDFQKMVVQTALMEMFTAKHFSICAVDACLKITGSIPNKKTYDALHALHCVNYSSMPSALREQIVKKTLSLFQNDGFDLSAFTIGLGAPAPTTIPAGQVQEPPKTKMGLLRRMLP